MDNFYGDIGNDLRDGRVLQKMYGIVVALMRVLVMVLEIWNLVMID